MHFPSIRRHRVEGMISPKEAELLTELATTVNEGCIVEVGSYRGYSTIALACRARVPVYAIEPHEAFEGVLGGHFGPADRKAFFKNLLEADVVESVRLVNLSSEIVAPGWQLPVGLLWIDGDHRYEAVRRDFQCWEPHVTGMIALHDSTGETLGPTRLVGELTKNEYRIVRQLEATTVLTRRAGAPAAPG
jgi:MMP 1-O-methyltransferase